MSESTRPGTCDSTSCSEHGNSLISCECQDGNHTEVKEQKKEENGRVDGYEDDLG